MQKIATNKILIPSEYKKNNIDKKEKEKLGKARKSSEKLTKLRKAQNTLYMYAHSVIKSEAVLINPELVRACGKS